jgi:hypothetical protein
VIRGLCDHPDRIAARIFVALRSDCNCCTFWRAIVLGLCIGAFVTILVIAALAHF